MLRDVSSMNLIAKFKHYLKYSLAGDELHELHRLKLRILDVRVWNSQDVKAKAITDYLLDTHNYPFQSVGARGSIEDFREYYKMLE